MSVRSDGPRISPRDFARVQRKAPSRAERQVWEMLRDRRAGAKFRRQHPIEPYTADFCCVEAKLIIEIDGPSHGVAEEAARDARRTAYLEEQGWRVLRVRDADVLSDPSGVLKRIIEALCILSPPSRGEG